MRLLRKLKNLAEHAGQDTPGSARDGAAEPVPSQGHEMAEDGFLAILGYEVDGIQGLSRDLEAALPGGPQVGGHIMSVRRARRVR